MRPKLIGLAIATGVAFGVVILLAGVASRPSASSVAGVSPQGASDSSTTAHFKVDGMYCALCAANLGRVLEEQPGVLAARIDFDNKRAVVQYDAKKATVQQLEDAIEYSGVFRAELVSGRSNGRE